MLRRRPARAGPRGRRAAGPGSPTPGSTCAPTRAATAATWPSSWTRRCAAASTSCSCARRAWRRGRSWRCWRSSPTPPRRHGALWRSTTGPTSRTRPAPTCCTSARTTCRCRAPAGSSAADMLIGRSTHDRRAGRRGRGRAGRRLLLRRAGAGRRRPSRAGPRPAWTGPVRAPRAPATRPWFAIGGIDAEQAGRGAGRGRQPGGRGPGDHRGGRPEAAARALARPAAAPVPARAGPWVSHLAYLAVLAAACSAPPRWRSCCGPGSTPAGAAGC